MDVEALLARRVAEARKAAGLEKRELAEALGLSKQGYGPYEEHGRYTVDQLFRLSRILGKSVSWFLGLDTGLTDDEDELLTLYRNASPAWREIIIRSARASRDAPRQP